MAANDADDPITVRELIAKLSALPQDWPVYVEGCDCFGSCVNADGLEEAAERWDDDHSAPRGRIGQPIRVDDGRTFHFYAPLEAHVMIRRRNGALHEFED